jgi:hypothetical protein
MSAAPPRRAGRLAPVLASLGALGATAFAVTRPPRLFNPDAVQYLSLAQHLATGDGYRSSLHYFHDLMQPPLYPLALSALVRLGAAPIGAAIAFYLACSVATVWLLWALHRRVWGWRGAWVTAALTAVCPALALGVSLTLEPLFLALAAAANLLAIDAVQRGGRARAALAGVVLGLALLTRSEAVLSIGVLLGVVVLGTPPGRRLLATALVVTGLAVVALPYGFWFRSHLGYFEVLPKIRYNLPVPALTDALAWPQPPPRDIDQTVRTLHTLMPDGRTFALDYAFAHPGFDLRQAYALRPHPGAGALGRRLRIGVRQLAYDALHRSGLLDPLALAAVLAALLGLSRRVDRVDRAIPSPSHQRLFAAALVVQFCAYLLPALAAGEDFQTRYLSPAHLFLLPLLGAGTAEIGRWLGRRFPAACRPVTRLFAAALIVSGAFHSWRLIYGQGGGPSIWARSAAIERAASQILPEGARVLATSHRYAYLRDGFGVQMPYVERLDELGAYARGWQAGYAIVDAFQLADHPSAIVRALSRGPAFWPPGWRPLAQPVAGTLPIWIVSIRLDP